MRALVEVYTNTTVTIDDIEGVAKQLESEGIREHAIAWREFAREVRAKTIIEHSLGASGRTVESPDGRVWKFQ